MYSERYREFDSNSNCSLFLVLFVAWRLGDAVLRCKVIKHSSWRSWRSHREGNGSELHSADSVSCGNDSFFTPLTSMLGDSNCSFLAHDLPVSLWKPWDAFCIHCFTHSLFGVWVTLEAPSVPFSLSLFHDFIFESKSCSPSGSLPWSNISGNSRSCSYTGVKKLRNMRIERRGFK